MPRITEKRDVQDQLINFLSDIGWTFIGRYDLPGWRGNDEKEPFLIDVLRRQLATLNGWAEDDARIDALVRRLRLLPASLDGNEQFLHALRGHWTAYDDRTQRERNVTFIDFDNLGANLFHFTEEMWFVDRDRRRMDMVLFVNGLPILLIENKSPRIEDPGLQGFDQVQTTYTEKIPEFIKYPIPFAICATRLEYGATWNPSTKAFYKWKVTVNGHSRDFGLADLSKSFFDPTQVLRLLRDYTLFYRMDDALQKYLLRPHQMRAVQKIVQRAITAQADPHEPGTGLESHTQGSGKTLTMIVAAHLLRRHPALLNPTVLIVVDRLELETQMLQNLDAFGLDAVRAKSSRHLSETLGNDSRGVIVTTIHKFDGMAKAIQPRRNVVVLVDEAHRSQEGDLGIYMRAALPHALFFGFTGTPVDRGKVGKGTFETFGHPADPHGIHDEYTINESIQDGTTLPLYYTLIPVQIWLDKLKLDTDFATLLDEFWALVDEEGAGTQEALSRLLQRADKLMAVLKSPERIEAIAAHIAGHFQENVLPRGFKALVVTPDREACALYKEALDQYLPASWSVVVYSQNPATDSALMKANYLDADPEKRVRKAFRDPTKEPKLLIVTQKLLTGYDAPVAYAMYLDKPLKDHTLLQAIARVNRPHPEKESGLVVDYMGIFKDLQRALSGNTAGVELGLIDLDTLRPRFTDLLGQSQTELAPLNLDEAQGRTERIIAHFWDEGRRESFTKLFKEQEAVYEVLSPDPFLRDFMAAYAEVVDVYETVNTYFDPKADLRRQQRDLLAKTEALISQHTHMQGLAAPMPLYPINRTLAHVVAGDPMDDRVKVINLQRSLITHIAATVDSAPYLVSISEAVDRIIQQLRERQISVQDALEELVAQANRMVEIGDERVRSALDDLAFALGITLRATPDLAHLERTDLNQLAEDLGGYLQGHEGWRHSPDLETAVRTEVWRQLLPHLPKPINPNRLKALADDLLKMHRIALS